MSYNWIEREEEYLEEQLNSGEISNAEFSKEIRDLHRSYREEALESAQCAYDNEIGRW